MGYLIPGFIHLKQRRNDRRMGPTVLVLSPTRELATQIQDEAVKFGKSSGISCTVCNFMLGFLIVKIDIIFYLVLEKYARFHFCCTL